MTALVVALALAQAPAAPPPDPAAEVGLAVQALALEALVATPLFEKDGFGKGREPGRAACSSAVADAERAREAAATCAAFVRGAREHGPIVELAAALALVRAGDPSAVERLDAWLAKGDARALAPWAHLLRGEALLARKDVAAAKLAIRAALVAPGTLPDRAAALRLASLEDADPKARATLLDRVRTGAREPAAQRLAALAERLVR